MKPDLVGEFVASGQLLSTVFTSPALHAVAQKRAAGLVYVDAQRRTRARRHGVLDLRPRVNVRCVQRSRVSVVFMRTDGRLEPNLFQDLPTSLRSVAEAVARGLSDKEVAQELDLPSATVRTYLMRCYARLGIRSRRELMLLRPPRVGAAIVRCQRPRGPA